MKFTLEGAYDLHIHTSPDVIPRKLGDEEMVVRAKAVGMRGCLLKCHAAPTAGRTVILKKMNPNFDVIGSITLNKSVGGINPDAVEAAGKMGARYVWFPTMDAKEYCREQGKPYEQALSVLTPEGEITPQVRSVLQVAREYDMVVGTGHIGTEEAIKLVTAAREMNLKRICVTHVTLPVCKMTLSQLEQMVAAGAVMEYSYCHILSGKCSIEYAAAQIKHIGAEHVILSSDLGQVNNPYPDEGLMQFVELLYEQGIHEEELTLMLKTNPRKLLYA